MKRKHDLHTLFLPKKTIKAAQKLSDLKAYTTPQLLPLENFTIPTGMFKTLWLEMSANNLLNKIA